MGGLSPMHLFLILVILLVVMGPSRLPGLGKSLGEAIRGFKKGLDGDEIDVSARRENLPPAQRPENLAPGQAQQTTTVTTVTKEKTGHES